MAKYKDAQGNIIEIGNPEINPQLTMGRTLVPDTTLPPAASPSTILPAPPQTNIPKVGDAIPGSNLRYEAEDIYNLQNGAVPFNTIQQGAPAPGSIADAAATTGYNFALSPEQQLEADRQKTLEESSYKAATATYDPQQSYRDAMSQYQQRIDSINSMYNDIINSSRTRNAPVYEGRVESRKFAQGRAGQIGSGTGEAGVNAVTSANMAEQAAAEAEVNARRNAEINAIYGKVDDSVSEAKLAYETAKKAGGETYLTAIKNKQTKRSELLAQAIAGAVTGDVELTPEEMKTIADKIGVDVSTVQSEYNTQKKTSDVEKAKVIKEAEKAALAEEKTRADIAKTTAETAQVGKMTPYQSGQLAIEKYKAEHPTLSVSDQAATAIGNVAQAFSPGATVPNSGGVPFIDNNGYATTEGFKTALKAAQQDKISRADFIKQFGHYVAPGMETGYGLTPAEIKLITGALPETK